MDGAAGWTLEKNVQEDIGGYEDCHEYFSKRNSLRELR